MSITSHGAQHVADATHGDEPLRPRGVSLDLAADVLHVHVANANAADVRAPPEVLHDRLARERALRLTPEQLGRATPGGRHVAAAPIPNARLLRESERDKSNVACHSCGLPVKQKAT